MCCLKALPAAVRGQEAAACPSTALISPLQVAEQSPSQAGPLMWPGVACNPSDTFCSLPRAGRGTLSPHRRPKAVSPFTAGTNLQSTVRFTLPPSMQKVPPLISRWPGWHYSRCDGATGMPVSAQLRPQMHSFQLSHLDGCNKNYKPSSTQQHSTFLQ